MKLASLATLSLILVLAAGGARATVFEPREFTAPEHEARYRTLIEELRCLVCQNQNLADSDADLAADLRRQVFEMIDAGDDDEAIIAFMTRRYGEFVLYRPRLKPSTVLLWFGPFALVVLALAILWRAVRRHRAGAIGAAPLTDAERRRARELLGSDP